jgi:hypothetical protein
LIEEEVVKIDGNCHCGSIVYQAEIDPSATRICHCTDCQTLTGSAYRANVVAPAESFVLLRGTPKIYIKTADSGAKRAHAFCGDCGTPIYAAATHNPTTYSLRVGSIKQRAEFTSEATNLVPPCVAVVDGFKRHREA